MSSSNTFPTCAYNIRESKKTEEIK